MQKLSIDLEDAQLDFIYNCTNYGFKDKTALIKTAIDKLRRELEQKQLQRSADLYAQLYDSDQELKELTESSISGWPE
jgi:hypothetical protein